MDTKTLLAIVSKPDKDIIWGNTLFLHDFDKICVAYKAGGYEIYAEWNYSPETFWEILDQLDAEGYLIRYFLTREEREALHESLYS